MQQAVDRWHGELKQLIQANMQAAMSQAEGYVERLEHEISELQRRDAELRLILETEDNIHFLQVGTTRRARCGVNAPMHSQCVQCTHKGQPSLYVFNHHVLHRHSDKNKIVLHITNLLGIKYKSFRINQIYTYLFKYNYFRNK